MHRFPAHESDNSLGAERAVTHHEQLRTRLSEIRRESGGLRPRSQNLVSSPAFIRAVRMKVVSRLYPLLIFNLTDYHGLLTAVTTGPSIYRSDSHWQGLCNR